jgi:hypothetical protein
MGLINSTISGSWGADGMASVIAHELAEAVTDPGVCSVLTRRILWVGSHWQIVTDTGVWAGRQYCLVPTSSTILWVGGESLTICH